MTREFRLSWIFSAPDVRRNLRGSSQFTKLKMLMMMMIRKMFKCSNVEMCSLTEESLVTAESRDQREREKMSRDLILTR